MPAVTHDDLERLEDRIGQRFDDMASRFDDIGKRFDDLREGSKSREQCIRLGFETIQKALQPGTLTLLIMLVALILGGSTAAMAVVQSYLPHIPAPNVQINSNNAEPPPPPPVSP